MFLIIIGIHSHSDKKWYAYKKNYGNILISFDYLMQYITFFVTRISNQYATACT